MRWRWAGEVEVGCGGGGGLVRWRWVDGRDRGLCQRVEFGTCQIGLVAKASN